MSVLESVLKRVPTVQDLIDKSMFEESKANDNEMLQMMEFFRDNSVPLTDNQVKAGFLLHENGLDDIFQFALAVRPMLTPTKTYHETINKFTLADRIKGTAKLSQIMKAQVASTSQQVPNANDYQAKALKEKDLK